MLEFYKAYSNYADLLFFSSSRRRHTRSYGDWSSDVCSSDLQAGTIVVRDRFPGLASALSSPATVPVEAVASWDVSAVDQVDLPTIHQFLDRRLSMPIPVRAYFASELASRVAPKVAGAPDRTHPEYLLERIVVAKQARA